MDITEHKQAETDLNGDRDYFRLHSDIANTFIKIPPSQYGKTIEDFLERVVELTGVDRGTLLYWPEGDTNSRVIYSWNREGIKQYHLPVFYEKLTYLAETLRRGAIFSFSDINEVSSEAEKDYFLNEGAKSTIIIPMMIEGNVLGALILASFRTTKIWPQDLVQKLRLIGQTFTYSLERKHAEETSRESEEKYRNLVELSPDPIIIIQDDRYRFINSAFTGLLGYTQEDVDNGLSFYKVVRDHDRETVSHRYQDRISEEQVGRRFAIDLISKEGKRIHFESSGIKINYDGRPAFMTILRDMTNRRQAEEALRKAHDELERRIAQRTAELSRANEKMKTELEERKQAEEKLRESEERLSLALDATQDGLWDWRVPENEVIFSPQLKEMLGYEVNERIPVSMDYWASKIHPDHHDRTIRHLEGNMERKESFNFYFLYLFKNGEYRWLNSRSIVLYDEKSKPYRVVGSVRDINKMKEAEDLIRNLTQSLITSQEGERQLISRELHDTVAQDLSSSKITCEMLLKYKSLTPGARKQISELSENLHKTLKSVRDLSYELRPPGMEKLGLVRTLYQLCKDFSGKTSILSDFQSAGIDNLNLDYNTKINLYRLLQEGLNNVRKHADASNIAVRLISSFPHIILRIEDNGKGFDLKERLAKAAVEKRMGLRSMKERASILGGRMDIESNPGKGTRVTIKIPYGDENIGAGKNQIDR